MKKVALHSLGCKVNSYETDAMTRLFEKSGYEIVPFTEKADIYVINTCTVTNIADRKSRQMLHRAKKNNPQSIVVAERQRTAQWIWLWETIRKTRLFRW